LWQQFDGESVCFEPKQFTRDELQSGRNRVLEKIYGYDSLYRRLTNLWEKGVFVRGENENRTLFTKGRLLFTLKALSFSPKKNRFIVKSLWNNKVTSTSAINLALNFNNYARNINKQSKNFVDSNLI
jgi:hypothetical protein